MSNRDNDDYVPPRINNGMPDFQPMGSNPTVDPRTAPERTPYETVRVTPQQNIDYIVGTPNVVMPPSEASPAVKPGR